MAHPHVQLRSLDTLWFQVGGTLCNLACTHCLVSASPTNRTHEMMTLEAISPYLEEALELGVREYYFTGGEPFLNPQMIEILERTLAQGPATVLTNGLLLDAGRCERLRRIADAADYSLDIRLSLDGYDAETNDPIRGAGSFRLILRGIRNLVRAGVNPVITVTEACPEAAEDSGKQRFFDLLRELGLTKPRLKVLAVFSIGAEASRSGSYADWQRLEHDRGADAGWDHLQCSNGRMVTSHGTWVCPILVNEPAARMGEAVSDGLGDFELSHPACWTCHVRGVSCRT
ncbi:MAG: radical SAM protein [bacterium]|nr:radical SAM protein [bacterium]